MHLVPSFLEQIPPLFSHYRTLLLQLSHSALIHPLSRPTGDTCAFIHDSAIQAGLGRAVAPCPFVRSLMCCCHLADQLEQEVQHDLIPLSGQLGLLAGMSLFSSTWPFQQDSSNFQYDGGAFHEGMSRSCKISQDLAEKSYITCAAFYPKQVKKPVQIKREEERDPIS